MSRYPQQHHQANTKPRRKRFADGSALVTYRDGSVLILESKLATESALRESQPVNYNDPPPPRRFFARHSERLDGKRKR
jgi:hypothetical protein